MEAFVPWPNMEPGGAINLMKEHDQKVLPWHVLGTLSCLGEKFRHLEARLSYLIAHTCQFNRVRYRLNLVIIIGRPNAI